MDVLYNLSFERFTHLVQYLIGHGFSELLYGLQYLRTAHSIIAARRCVQEQTRDPSQPSEMIYNLWEKKPLQDIYLIDD